MQAFLYQTFLYVVFQSSIGVYFRTATNYLRLTFYKNRKQMLPASIMKKMLIIIIIIKIIIIMINNNNNNNNINNNNNNNNKEGNKFTNH